MKGKLGELKLDAHLLSLDFVRYKGYSLRNVYIPRKDGTTSEIDLIYITRKGLFVIESKNYTGYIFGNECWNEWSSTLYGGKDWLGREKIIKNRFYNPIKQNRGHIRALMEYCGDVRAFSIIAFGDQCEFKDIYVESTDVSVCYYSQIKNVIKSIWNSYPDIYDDATVDRIYSILSSQNNGQDVRVAHVKQVHDWQNSMKCPVCGGVLVLRQAKKGKNAGGWFYGCSNYPRCRFVGKIGEKWDS